MGEALLRALVGAPDQIDGAPARHVQRLIGQLKQCDAQETDRLDHERRFDPPSCDRGRSAAESHGVPLLALQRQRLAEVPVLHLPIAQQRDLLENVGQGAGAVPSGSGLQPLNDRSAVSPAALRVELADERGPARSRQLRLDRCQRLLLDACEGLAGMVPKGALGGQQRFARVQPIGCAADEFLDGGGVGGRDGEDVTEIGLGGGVEVGDAGMQPGP